MNPVGTLAKTDQASEIAARPQIPLDKDEQRVLSAFKDGTALDWEDWRWQIRNRIRTKEVLQKIIELTPQEERGIEGAGSKLTMSIPPYFASLIDPDNPRCPIR